MIFNNMNNEGNASVSSFMDVSLYNVIKASVVKSLTAFKRDIREILQIVAIPIVIMAVVAVLSMLHNTSISILIGVIFYASIVWASVVLIKIMYMSVTDAKVDVAAARKGVLSAVFKLIGFSIIYSAIVMVGYLLFIIPGLIWSYTYIFAPYAIVIDGMGVFDAMSWSKKKTRGKKLNVFIFISLLTIAFYVVILIGTILMMIASALLAAANVSELTIVILMMFTIISFTIIVEPIYLGSFLQVYHSLKK